MLASTSPRRIELLRLITPHFLVVPPKGTEDDIHAPGDLVAVARGKAAFALGQFPQAVVIAADTGVFRNGRAYGKPRERGEAAQTLRELAGGWHSVFTGLVVLRGEQERVALVETRVQFKELREEEINWYLAKETVLDKAGAYAIQGQAALFVERIEGDFFNVMGLPLNVLYRTLGALGWFPWRG